MDNPDTDTTPEVYLKDPWEFGLAVNRDADAHGNKITNLGDPVDDSDAVNYGFMLDHIGVSFSFYFDAASVMKQQVTFSETYVTETLSTASPITMSTLFKSSVADTPTPFTVDAGTQIFFHINAKQATTTGYKAVTLQARLFYVDSDGTSNKTAIAAISGATGTLTTTKTYYEIHSHVGTAVTVPVGKRLWAELYANVTGSGNNPVVWIYISGVDDHVSYSTEAGILGSFTKRAGDLTATRIPFVDANGALTDSTNATITTAGIVSFPNQSLVAYETNTATNMVSGAYTPIPYEDKLSDPQSEYTVATGIVTVTVAGAYIVDASAMLASHALIAGDTFELLVFYGASFASYRYLYRDTVEANVTKLLYLHGSCPLILSAGAQFKISLYNGHASDIALYASASSNHLSVIKVA